MFIYKKRRNGWLYQSNWGIDPFSKKFLDRQIQFNFLFHIANLRMGLPRLPIFDIIMFNKKEAIHNFYKTLSPKLKQLAFLWYY